MSDEHRERYWVRFDRRRRITPLNPIARARLQMVRTLIHAHAKK
jgi:hypothetical protein